MPRRPARPDPLPSPKVPVALAVAALASLAFARWRLDRPDVPPPAVDPASYVAAIAPVLRRAGCAAARCHGGTALPHLSPAPGTASAVLAELAEVRGHLRAGPATESPLLRRALDPAHAGAGALPADGCEAGALARWIHGGLVRPCPTSLPDGGPGPSTRAP